MLKAGLISVPLSIKLLAEEVPFRINHSEAAWAVVSRITLPKVLDTWDKLESKPFLILLDPPEDDELHRMESLKINAGKGWVTWPDLLKEGEAELEKDPELLARSEEKIDENDTVNICYTSGKVVPSVTCKIMKSDTEEAAVGEIGEIVIRGDNVMKGYFKNPEASAEALRDGWLWTGDLARYDEDGFLVVVGRQKALLISADGEKYPPEEIEEAIANSSDLFNHIMAYNEQKKFTTALVTLNEEACRALFKKEGIESPEAALSLLKDHFLRYRRAGVDKKIPTPWAPVLFEIIEEQFSEQNGLINSTMKMVRHKATERHRERIEAMYRDEELFNPRNLGALKGLFFS